MSRERFSIDTNILVYSIDSDAGEKHSIAVTLMDALVEYDCIITLQALAEFFHAVTRKGKAPISEAQEIVNDWMLLFPIATATPKKPGSGNSMG